MACKFCEGKLSLLHEAEKEFGVNKSIYAGIRKGVIEIDTYANKEPVNAEIKINYCPICSEML